MAFPAPELLVLHGARAIDPATSLDAIVDAVVERGIITRLGASAAHEIPQTAGMHVDANGSWLLPGLVDLHAHLREPGHEYKEDIASGLAAAAAGGYVHICAMPNTRPVNDCRAITELMVARAREIDGVRLSPIGAITVGQKGEQLAEMADMRAAGAVGVSDDGRCVMSAAVMRRALEYARTHDLVTIQHAEDHTLTDGAQMHEGANSTRLGLRGWPRVAEDVIVARDLLLAELTGARYHVAHLSSHVSARLVAEAKGRGLAVTAEVTPHHLLLTDAALLGYDAACKVNPPLREQVDVDAMWAALRDGTIDAVATDHAPHSPLEKDVELAQASPGMIGLELCLPLLIEQSLAGKVPLGRLIDAFTRAPARIASLEAPTLREGAPANFCLFDPRVTWVVGKDTLRSKSANTPFFGRELHGAITMTVARGRIVHRRGGVS
jgi:dihydroorotase